MGNSVTRPKVELEFSHNGDRLLHLLRQQHPDYHPILNIARIAHNAEITGGGPDGDQPNPELALKAHTTVLRYVEPELKSVEVTIGKKDPRIIEVSLFDDSEPAKDLVKSLEVAEEFSMVVDGELIDDRSTTQD
jgi:hypothetical protein